MGKQLELFATPTVEVKGARLIDMFLGGDERQLKRTDCKTASTTAELKLLSKINQLMNCELDQFHKVLNDWLQETTFVGSRRFWLFYKLKRNSDTLEVWHTNSQGDFNRQVCTIQKL